MNSRKQKSIFKELYYKPYKKHSVKLYEYTKDNLSLVQRLGLIQNLPLHTGCVNTLCWNENGNLLLSGSDDQHLVVTNGHTYQVECNYRTSHRANIFSAKFMPCSGDRNIVSCSGDGIVLYTDLERQTETFYNQFTCHSGTTYEVITIPNDPNTFLSCGEDGSVRWFDLRVKTRCKKSKCREDIMLLHHRAVTALSINPMSPHELAVGSSDSTVRIYDRRRLAPCGTSAGPGFLRCNPDKTLYTFAVPELEDRTYRITSLSYSPDGQEMLVSYSSDHLYLFRVKDQTQREFLRGKNSAKSGWAKLKSAKRSPPPVRRLRLRGDWSDTGPDARPERDTTSTLSIGQARPQLQATLMERMTNVLFRMLNDPLTRAALSAGGEDSLETNSSSAHSQDNQGEAAPEPSPPEQAPQDRRVTAVDLEIHESYASQSSAPSQPNPEVPSTSRESPKPCSSTSHSSNSDELNNLRDTLSTLRDGFISKHGSEPSVSLRYSEQSSSNATMRLDVADELNRSNYNAQTESATNQDTSMPQEATPTDLSTSAIDADNTTAMEIDHTDPHEDVTPTNDPNEETLLENSNMGENLMDFSSNDELVNEIVTRTQTGRSSPDVLLDYSSSDDEADFPKSSRSQKCHQEENRDGFEPHVIQKYVGHRNARTMIKEATFWGNDYVMSGSDCGHVFMWERESAKLVMLLEADHHVVNCLQPHPTLPLLATSGIDHDVKLWSPVLEEPNFDTKMAEDLMKRNEVMLEETRDTITVPAAFMIRMLACLNQIRRTGSLSRARRREDDDQENS